MPQVFISHSSRDRAFVDNELIPLLKGHSIVPWHSQESIASAALWEKQIRQGLFESEWFLVVISRNSADSEWVQAEVQWALEKRKDRIIPVLIEDCDPSETHLQLIRYQLVDFRTDPATARERLISIFGRRFQSDRVLEIVFRIEMPNDDINASSSLIRRILIVDGISIGRDPNSDLCLSDPSVSRKHAAIKVLNREGHKSLMLFNLFATLGVCVNGNSINSRALIATGDVILIGKVQLTVERVNEVATTENT